MMNIFQKLSLRILKKNRMRTVVTIIGIILSMTLFTAVFEGAWSGLVYVRSVEEYKSGAYHGILSQITEKDVRAVEQIKDIDRVKEIREVGFARISSKSRSNPYLYISSIEKDMDGMIPLTLLSGRLPENAGEIVLPDNLTVAGGKTYAVGDNITLSVGERQQDGKKAESFRPYIETEKIADAKTHIYKVVGIVKRTTSDLVPYDCPGFVAFTAGDPGDGTVSAAFTVKDPGRFIHVIEENPILSDAAPHTALLKLYGIHPDSGTAAILFGFILVLLIMIVFGTVSLIRNSFAISVSERTRDYGMLRSIGATKRQLRSSVRFEALVLSVIGIPAGFLIGCAGLGITLYALRDAIALYGGPGNTVRIHLALNPLITLAAILLCLLTVTASAMHPLRKALRISPIDAIRQSSDIKIKKKDAKTGERAWKKGRFYSAMAEKNSRRYGKRSRSTVFAIFLSVVLFIAASSWISYMEKEMQNSFAEQSEADVTMSVFTDKKMADITDIFTNLCRSGEVTDGEMEAVMDENFYFFAGKNAITEEYADNFGSSEGTFSSEIRFLDDNTFGRSVKKTDLMQRNI